MKMFCVAIILAYFVIEWVSDLLKLSTDKPKNYPIHLADVFIDTIIITAVMYLAEIF